jgi:hypothetical protein
MSQQTDRIFVPTNGKGPHAVEEPGAEPGTPVPAPDESTAAFTPTQLAVGFGILASLIVLAVRQLRRRGR